MRAVLLVVMLVAGCGGESQKMADASVDAYDSVCGHPGDMGNELGVGKFCPNGINDCSMTPAAPLCSSLGDSRTHFCTKTCPMGSMTACGTDAQCVCNNSNQCGCTPSSCLGP